MYDLTLKSGFLCAGVFGVGTLAPCYSFSMPKASPRKMLPKSRWGIFMRFSVWVMSLGILLGIPFSMEKPSSSWLWPCPGVLHLFEGASSPCPCSSRFVTIPHPVGALDGPRQFETSCSAPLLGRNKRAVCLQRYSANHPGQHQLPWTMDDTC